MGMNLRQEFNSNKFRSKIKELLGGVCVNCESSINIQYHHIVPLSLGGTNNIKNIVPLCEECHSKIHNQKNIHWRQLQKEGIRTLKERNNGKGIGRPKITIPEGFEEVYNNWKAREITEKVAMEQLGLKRTTFYRLVKEYKGG